MSRLLKYSVWVLVVVLTISCKVGPNFRGSTYEAPSTYRYVLQENDSLINLLWWEVFDDPVLDSLIRTALLNNKDVQIAASRVEQARANVGFNRAELGPKLGYNANAGRTNLLQSIHLEDPINSFSSSLVVNWEIDFWGKYRRATEAAKAELLASFYGKRAVELALISEVAQNYFLLMDYRTRLDIAKNTFEIRDSALQIINLRFEKGYTHIIDVDQAVIQKGIAGVAIPFYERQIGFTENNLNVLLGRNPAAIPTNNFLENYDLPDSIPVGVPSEIMLRRPDILQAEQFYRAQNARIGVAQAMRFPSFGLTGLLGLASTDLSDLVTNGLGWSVGAGLTGPLFEWGKNARRVDIEREKTKQGLLAYENTALSAFREVNNALLAIKTHREALKYNQMILDAAENASFLSRERYYQGVTSYLEVIENQRQEFEAKLNYSQNYQELLNSYVNLYKSLGGGWISEEELEKYKTQIREDGSNTTEELSYRGQVVDLDLTEEQVKAKKAERKKQRKLERAQRK